MDSATRICASVVDPVAFLERVGTDVETGVVGHATKKSGRTGIERSDIRLVASHAAPQGALKHYSFARGASPRARRAMDRWAERLSEIVGGTASGQVVSFPGNS